MRKLAPEGFPRKVTFLEGISLVHASYISVIRVEETTLETREQICKIFPRGIREILIDSSIDFEHLCALRVRANKPIIFEMEDGERFIDSEGCLISDAKSALCINMEDIKRMLEFICSFSLYAYDDEMRQGFITIEGGHRIGIAGSVSLVEGHVDRMKYISCLNVRVAHEIRGCGDECMDYMYEDGVLQNTIIVSGCGRGKTTILRDIIRQISDGNGEHAGVSVGVVDERSEIGACHHGIPQNDLGMRTDIMDGCPKAYGLRMLIRSMAPKVLAVDELGGVSDLEAVRFAVASGCKLIATIHAADMRELKNIPMMKKLLSERLITRLIFLRPEGRPGQISRICDGMGGEIFIK